MEKLSPNIKKKLKVVVRKKIRFIDMFSLTESAKSVLNGLVIHYAKQLWRTDITASYREEMTKKEYEIAYLRHKFWEIDTAEKLEKIILQYAPILKAFNQAK